MEFATKIAKPFSALISISSLLIGILYVAGFAYRWSYYYNFGVQHVVFTLSVQSFLVTSFELIRTPSNVLAFFVFVILPFIAFNLALSALVALGRKQTVLGKAAI